MTDSAPLLLVTQRPLEYGGGGSVRWQYLRDALPRHGWEVEDVSARPNPTANAVSTDPRAARLAAARAKVMAAVGAATRPSYRRLGIQPEAFPPNALWSLTGRGASGARSSERGRTSCGPRARRPSALFAATRRDRRARLPLVAEMRDLWAGNPYFDAGGHAARRGSKAARSPARPRSSPSPTSCADRMLALHPEIAPRLEVLPNGFDPVLLELRDRLAAAGRPRHARARRHALRRPFGGHADARAVATRARGPHAARARRRRRPAHRGGAAAHHARCEVVVEPPMPWRDGGRACARRRHRGRDQQPRNRRRHGGPEQALRGARARHAGARAHEPGSETERLLQRLGHDAGCAPPGDEAAIARDGRALLDAPPPAVDPAALAPFSRAAVAERVAALLDRLAGAS